MKRDWWVIESHAKGEGWSSPHRIEGEPFRATREEAWEKLLLRASALAQAYWEVYGYSSVLGTDRKDRLWVLGGESRERVFCSHFLMLRKLSRAEAALLKAPSPDPEAR